MRVTLFGGARGAVSTPARARVDSYASASAFLDWLETVPSVACADEDAKRDSPGFALAHWRDGADSKAHAMLAHDAATEVLPFDIDKMTAAEIADALPRWHAMGLDLCVYATWAHTPEAPRLRLLVALDAPLPVTDKRVHRAVYRAAAERLGLKFDTHAASASNLYFLPQHKPDAGPGPRIRWRGAPMALGKLLEASHAAQAAAEADGGAGIEGVGARPDRGELKQLAGRMRKRSNPSNRRAGLALQAVVRGEPYAEHGHVYGITQDLSFALAFEIPDLDEPWFRGQWLAPCWRQMWPGEALEKIETDWASAWRSGLERSIESRAEWAADRAAITPDAPAELDARAIDAVAAHKGALICAHGNGYYVFDPRRGHYSQPVRAGAVATRARDLLAGVGGVQITEPRDNGRPVAKSPTQLLMDYGVAIDDVHYWARPPVGRCYDAGSRSIKIGAYRWNEWEPRYSRIADDLWRTMAGDAYPTFEAWLSKFRLLERPLPALVLVGPKGTWKSKTAQHLSRFWGDPDAPGACKADQVLGRFSGPLLHNPVVWSDEQLAKDERGRAIPETYRRSISETAHQVERKGIDPVTLHSALRHVIAVNDLDLVFSREVEGDAVHATLDRYLIVHVDGDAMAAFETRWAGTPEIERLRTGEPLLEHAMWLEAERAVPDAGRFGVETHTDPDVLARAQFSNDVLNLILQVATDAVLLESARSMAGDAARMPIRMVDGVLRFAPRVLVDMWADARATKGFRGSTPTIVAVDRALTGAGFRGAGAGGPDGFPFDGERWATWLRLGEVYDLAEVGQAIAKVLK